MSRAITRATIDTKGKKIDFVFHDADTDQLGEPGRMAGNYHANAGIIQVGVSRARQLSIGNPESVGAEDPSRSALQARKALMTSEAYTCGAPPRERNRYARPRTMPFTGNRLLGQGGRRSTSMANSTEFGFIITTERLEQVRW